MEEETDIEIDKIFTMISQGLVIPAMTVYIIL